MTLSNLRLKTTEKKLRAVAKAVKVIGIRRISFEQPENATKKSAVIVFETKEQAVIARQNFNKHGYKGIIRLREMNFMISSLFVNLK